MSTPQVLCKLPLTSDSSGLSGSGNAPLDASTHTPSQYANAGHETAIAHDDVGHNYAGRHGSKVGDDLAKYGGGHV